MWERGDTLLKEALGLGVSSSCGGALPAPPGWQDDVEQGSGGTWRPRNRRLRAARRSWGTGEAAPTPCKLSCRNTGDCVSENL